MMKIIHTETQIHNIIIPGEARIKNSWSTQRVWDELTHKEKVTRWIHAVRVIENLNDHEIKNHFRMDTWGEKTDCGTIGCAAGLCGLNPTIRKMGFKMYPMRPAGSKFSTAHRAYRFSISPIDFFGRDAYYNIFTNHEFVTQCKCKRLHKRVLKAMKKYLQDLQDLTDA